MGGEPPAPTARSWLYHPAFPEHWKRRPLYALANWVNGLAFREIQFSPTGKPVVKIAEIKGGISGQTKFTRQTFDESVRIRYGDLLFSWSGQPETSIDAFWWRGPEGWLNQHVFRVTPCDGIDRTFFYYLLRYLRPHFVGIARNKQTTGLGHVTKRDLESIEAAIPSPAEQRAIARALGTIDDKIELTRRMSETLEAIARALFKSWFVDFDPVRAKAERRDPELPTALADLFPHRLGGSELGEIPRGWRTTSWGDLVTLEYGKSLAGYEDNVGTFPVYGTNGRIGSHAAPLCEHAGIIIGRKGAYRGIHFCGEPFFVIDTAFYVEPRKPIELRWAYYELRRQDINGMDSGSAIPSTSRGDFYDLPVVCPPAEVQGAFARLLSPLWARQQQSDKEAQILAALRDALLPRLFSGELRVKDSAGVAGRQP